MQFSQTFIYIIPMECRITTNNLIKSLIGERLQLAQPYTKVILLKPRSLAVCEGTDYISLAMIISLDNFNMLRAIKLICLDPFPPY